MIDPRIATIYDADYTGPLFFTKDQRSLVIPYSASIYNDCCPRQDYGYYPLTKPPPQKRAIPINVPPYYHTQYQNPDGSWPEYRCNKNGTLY